MQNEEVRSTKRTDLFLVDPRNIVVMDGFNVRQDFDLKELKEQIKDKGVLNPITVIPFRDEHGVEKYKLVDGERRYRATMMAIQEGADIQYIKALKAPRDASMMDLYVEQMMRNEGKQFTEYECAIMYRRFRDEFGYNQAQIAQTFHKSPASISKSLALLDLPEYLQRKIATREMSVNAAKDIAANFDTQEEQVETAKIEIRKAREQGKKSVTSKQLNTSLQQTKEAKSIAESLRKILEYLKGEQTINIVALADSLDQTGNLELSVKQLRIK